MPAYTIETTYNLPIFRHGTYIADTPEAACKEALGDDNWESLQKDYDSSGEIHVTGIWEGENAAYAGSPITVPSQFDEAVQRRANHFEALLGLLKVLFQDARAARPPSTPKPPRFFRRSTEALCVPVSIGAAISQFGRIDPDGSLSGRSVPQSQKVEINDRI